MLLNRGINGASVMSLESMCGPQTGLIRSMSLVYGTGKTGEERTGEEIIDIDVRQSVHSDHL